MDGRILIALSLSLLLLSISCQNSTTTTKSNGNAVRTTPSATPDQFAEARAFFAKNCQTCHGPTGSGGPVKLEDGTKLKVPSLREGHALRHPDSDFVKQITKGGDGMPAFKDKLTPQQITEVISFIRHDFQGGMTPPPERTMSPMTGMK
jgi:mono/diheme cytochrome c family protein